MVNTQQNTQTVLQNRTETCVRLFTNVTPIESIQIKNECHALPFLELCARRHGRKRHGVGPLLQTRPTGHGHGAAPPLEKLGRVQATGLPPGDECRRRSRGQPGTRAEAPPGPGTHRPLIPLGLVHATVWSEHSLRPTSRPGAGAELQASLRSRFTGSPGRGAASSGNRPAVPSGRPASEIQAWGPEASEPQKARHRKREVDRGLRAREETQPRGACSTRESSVGAGRPGARACPQSTASPSGGLQVVGILDPDSRPQFFR